MLACLAHAEYENPTPVQAGLIPRALAGADILGQARTGTGKTAAFAIPILELLKTHKRGGTPRALILTPTRELAVQVRDEIDKLAYGRRIASVTLHGGKPIRGQIDKLNKKWNLNTFVFVIYFLFIHHFHLIVCCMIDI